MNILITVVTVLAIFGILYGIGARQNRRQAASAAPAFSVEYETEFWEELYREFSCSWKYSGSDLVIEYEIKNPTDWPWYGGSSVTLAAVVLDADGNHKSVRTAIVQDYELRLFLCQGTIRIPYREVEDGDRICVTVVDE